MEPARIRDRSWFAQIAVVFGLIFTGLVALMFLGSQASGVLSTVGASVGGPYGPGPGIVAQDDPSDGDDGDSDTTGRSDGDPGSDSGGIVHAVARDDLLIIKTGSLVLQVAGIDAALTAASQQVTALGGYVSGSERNGDGESDQSSVTFRIPAASWEQALAGLRSLGTKVLFERAATEDVTAQVVDLGARVRNLEATELALQGIMDRAVDIDDVLSVQAELTSVRGQIEQLTAQKTHLEAQAAMSTLTVTFSLKPDPVLASTEQFDPASQVDQAAASLVGVLQAIATAGIWFAIVWLPILLGLAVFAAIGIFVLRRFRRPVSAALPMAPGTEG
ncbi:MAG TPA: DUF4349 domain-containing protein [Candidatus Limnocylindria bacterium]|nr:DUF4349 domain-containing protein [Candidatus Limnocylindria bacterium]